MKLINLLGLALLLQFSNLNAAREILCDFSSTDFYNIESLKITDGKPGQVLLVHSNGQKEMLNAEKGVGGIFNQIIFSEQISRPIKRKINYAKVTSKILGEIKMSFICNRPNSISCDTRGSGFAKESLVSVNVNGDIVKFNNRELSACSRTVNLRRN